MPNAQLHGEYNRCLDDKGGLALPKEVLKQLAESESTGVFVRGSPNFQESILWFFPERSYERLHAARANTEEMAYSSQMLELASIAPGV